MNSVGNKYGLYDSVKDSLSYEGIRVEQYKEIGYGLQFEVSFGGKRGLLRIYESKKGTRVDPSQIKDEVLRDRICSLLDLNGDESMDRENPQAEGSGALIGTDESGKGDFFGPLVVAGVLTTPSTSAKLSTLGTKDSKKLSDETNIGLAAKIRELCPFSVVVIGNRRYNELYDSIGNLNQILAWGHARVIENILEKETCDYVLSDQFGDKSLIQNALMQKGKKIILTQRPKAESNVAVAAASILARDEYLRRLHQMNDQFGIPFPKGATQKSIITGRLFVQRYGRDELANVAKLHFKTSKEIVDDRPS